MLVNDLGRSVSWTSLSLIISDLSSIHPPIYHLPIYLYVTTYLPMYGSTANIFQSYSFLLFSLACFSVGICLSLPVLSKTFYYNHQGWG